ncbi:hypothetical protein V2I01_26865 [Micromonospora sp. BRA006-A]|nr:hypothetical protein [Micromonospora sp. BRA006-A]
MNNDGHPDLWAIGDGGLSKIWRVTGLTGAAGTITAETDRKILTADHAWHFGEATEGWPASAVPAQDAAGSLAATGSGAAAWHSPATCSIRASTSTASTAHRPRRRQQ